MVLMRYAHLPAATTSQQSAEARMRFVAGRRLRHAEHIGVNEQRRGHGNDADRRSAARHQSSDGQLGRDPRIASEGLFGIGVTGRPESSFDTRR